MFQSPDYQNVTTDLVVVFGDGAVYSRVPHGATLADICGSVQRFSRRRKGSPCFVKVHFGALTPDIHAARSDMLRSVLNMARTRRLTAAKLVNPLLRGSVFPPRDRTQGSPQP